MPTPHVSENACDTLLSGVLPNRTSPADVDLMETVTSVLGWDYLRPVSMGYNRTVINTANLGTVPSKCHGDDTHLLSHDTHSLSL